MKFTFKTNQESSDYCDKIMRAMTLLYDFSPIDALNLINGAWAGQDFLGSQEEDVDKKFDIRYHETYWYWAEQLCNPNPCTDDVQQIIWRQRKNEAARRLKLLEEQGHEW